MAGSMFPGNTKFSIHSILGEGNAGMAAPSTALHPSPTTLVSIQEAAFRAAYGPYPSPCQPVPSSATSPAFHPSTHQINSTAAMLRSHPQQTPMAWQPLAIYQDPRPWHPLAPNTDSLATYQQTAPGCISCFGYDTPSMPLGSGHPRPPFSFGALKLKRKKTRTVFTRSQIDKLEMTFNGKRYLSSNDRVQLSLALKMTETQVKVWFQNRRNKWKREMANKSPSSNRQDGGSHGSGRSSASPERSEDESDVDVASETGSDDSAGMESSSRPVSNTSTSPGPYVPFAVVCR